MKNFWMTLLAMIPNLKMKVTPMKMITILMNKYFDS
jgi:hypothetical protein